MKLKILSLIFVLSGVALAETQRSIVVRGRAEVTVTVANITLADVADVSGKESGLDEALIALKKISID